MDHNINPVTEYQNEVHCSVLLLHEHWGVFQGIVGAPGTVSLQFLAHYHSQGRPPKFRTLGKCLLCQPSCNVPDCDAHLDQKASGITTDLAEEFLRRRAFHSQLIKLNWLNFTESNLGWVSYWFCILLLVSPNSEWTGEQLFVQQRWLGSRVLCVDRVQQLLFTCHGSITAGHFYSSRRKDATSITTGQTNSSIQTGRFRTATASVWIQERSNLLVKTLIP